MSSDFIPTLLSNIWSIFLIVLFFGGSIFVHELGHFLAARRRGLKVDRFSIGFGPALWKKRGKDGCEYRISVLPLGGYVALPQLADLSAVEGESQTDVSTLPPISYATKMIVFVAGVVFNVIFAFLLACVLWVIKQPINSSTLSTTIGYVAPTTIIEEPDGKKVTVASPAAEGGLRIDDKIISIDGHPVRTWHDVTYSIITGSGRNQEGIRESTFIVEREGKQLTIVLRPRQIGDEQLRHVGIDSAYDVLVAEVPKESIAKEIGLNPEDRLLSIGGVPIKNDQTYFDILTERCTETLPLVVSRNKAILTLSVPPRPNPIVAGIIRNSLAHQLGIRTGDKIVAIEDHPISNSKEFMKLLIEKMPVSFKLTVERDGKLIDFTVPARPDRTPVGIFQTQLLGESLSDEQLMWRIGPLEQCVNVVSESYRTLLSLLNPHTDIGLSNVSGPIEILRIYHIVSRTGIRNLIALTILVNLSLAIFNILPIPILDGGQMVFATIVKLRNRPLSPNFVASTTSVFLFLLLGMILYVSFFNVRRWSRDNGRSISEENIIRESAPAEASAQSKP